MSLKIEVHASSNGVVTGIVYDRNTGSSLLFLSDGSRWHPLAATHATDTHYYNGEDYLMPVEVEGDLNRARDAVMLRARNIGSYATISYPPS